MASIQQHPPRSDKDTKKSQRNVLQFIRAWLFLQGYICQNISPLVRYFCGKILVSLCVFVANYSERKTKSPGSVESSGW